MFRPEIVLSTQKITCTRIHVPEVMKRIYTFTKLSVEFNNEIKGRFTFKIDTVR